MPKDHYVAQTYLDHFCDADSKLWVYSKEWGSVKDKTTGQICYEHGGSDNPYLKCPRAIEEYLKPFENGWSAAVKLLDSDSDIDFRDYLDAKSIIAGYVPYLRFFTPAAVRTQNASLAATVKTSIKILTKMGKISPPPPGYEFLLEDIERNIDVDVDGNYPKAIATGGLMRMTQRLFKFPWMRVINHTDTPFITSDNPTCFWYLDGANIPMTYFPVTPKLGILIKPLMGEEDSKHYDHTEDGNALAKPEFVTKLNDLVIKNAEKIVIANQKSTSFSERVSALKNWRYECTVHKVPMERGELVISRMEALERTEN